MRTKIFLALVCQELVDGFHEAIIFDYQQLLESVNPDSKLVYEKFSSESNHKTCSTHCIRSDKDLMFFIREVPCMLSDMGVIGEVYSIKITPQDFYEFEKKYSKI